MDNKITSPEGFAEWKQSTVVRLGELGFPADYSGWTNRPGFKGLGVPKVPRVHALLNLGWARRLSQASEEQKERKEQAEPLDIKGMTKMLLCGHLPAGGTEPVRPPHQPDTGVQQLQL